MSEKIEKTLRMLLTEQQKTNNLLSNISKNLTTSVGKTKNLTDDVEMIKVLLKRQSKLLSTGQDGPYEQPKNESASNNSNQQYPFPG